MSLIVLDRNETPVGELTTAKNVQLRERLNGESLLSFEIPFDNEETELLDLEGYVKLNDQLYVIKSIEQNDNNRKYLVVQAVHVYIELVDDYIDRIVELFGTTINNAVTEALTGTEFTVGYIDPEITELHDIELTEINIQKALQKIREKWDVDMWFDNRTVSFGTRGANNGVEIRYGKNLKTLRRPTSTSNVITRLYVYGRDGLTVEASNGGKKYIDSPNLYLYRKPKIGTVKFNDITNVDELLAEGKRYLEKHDTPEISYQVDFVDLAKIGYTDVDIALGDTVTITHLPFNLETAGSRVVEYTSFPLEPRPGSITLSSFIETMVDDYVSIKRRQIDFERYSTERDAVFYNDIADVQTQIDDTNTYIDGTFRDGVIDESEAKAIREHLNQLDVEKADVDSRYNSVYNNVYLTDVFVKNALYNAKNDYDAKHTALIDSINTAIADGKVTDTEKADVDAKFSDYKTSLGTLSDAFESAMDDISKNKAGEAESNANGYTDTQISEVNSSLSSLETSINDFSNDNKLTLAEANALKTSLNQVNAESTDLTSMATTLSITTEKTNYETALDDLTTYLTSNWIDQASYPIDITDTDRSAIQTKFETVQDTKSVLINRIASVREALAKVYTDNTTGNLLNNTTKSGNLDRWFSNIAGTLSVVNKDFFGNLVPVHQVYTDVNALIRSEKIEVDPSKAYEVSLWMNVDSAIGTDFFGIYAYDENGTRIPVNSYNIINGSFTSNTDNFYFWSGTNQSNEWIKRVGYILPTGSKNFKDLGANVRNAVELLANTKTIEIRYLNYYNDGVFKNLWIANPKLVEMADVKSVIDKAEQNAKDASVPKGVKFDNSVMIGDGNGIRVLDANDVARVILGQYATGQYGLKVTNGAIYSTTIRSGTETATDYIQLSPGFQPFEVVKNGRTALDIFTMSDRGVVSFFDTNLDEMGGQIFAFDDALGQGLRVHARYYNGSDATLNLIGNPIRMDGYVDVSNDLYVWGSKNAAVTTETQGSRLLYALEMPESKFMDEGIAKLTNGLCRVDLDPIFLETIEPNTVDTPFIVRATNHNEFMSLRVKEIGDTYFIVEEENGKSGQFVWELTATRKGYATTRLERIDDDDVLTSGWEDTIL